MRVRATSLRIRLMLAAAVTIFLALALGWLGLTVLFERHIERRESAALIRLADPVLASLQVGSDGGPVIDSPGGDNRFNQLASGLYWQVSAGAHSVSSASLWDQNLPHPASSRQDDWTTRHIMGPFHEPLLVVDRLILPEADGPPMLVQVAENERELQAAGAEFRRESAIFLSGLWLLLLIGTYVQVQLGLRPLGHLREQLVRLQKSPTARLDERFPDEIIPLSEAINRLATSREADLARARRRAGDLAHSLKTPLSVMAAQSRKVRAAGLKDQATGMDRAITAIGAALETELARSRAAAARDAVSTAHAPILAVVDGLVAVIERTDAGERIAFDLVIADDLTAPLSPDDLAELLGALIENAVRYARTVVRVSAQSRDDGVIAMVEDDGPGIADTSAAAAMMRGGRLDEAGTGHGLGLGIVRDLAEATEAEVALGRSELGGLQAEVRWHRC